MRQIVSSLQRGAAPKASYREMQFSMKKRTFAPSLPLSLSFSIRPLLRLSARQSRLPRKSRLLEGRNSPVVSLRATQSDRGRRSSLSLARDFSRVNRGLVRPPFDRERAGAYLALATIVSSARYTSRLRRGGRRRRCVRATHLRLPSPEDRLGSHTAAERFAQSPRESRTFAWLLNACARGREVHFRGIREQKSSTTKTVARSINDECLTSRADDGARHEEIPARNFLRKLQGVARRNIGCTNKF